MQRLSLTKFAKINNVNERFLNSLLKQQLEIDHLKKCWWCQLSGRNTRIPVVNIVVSDSLLSMGVVRTETSCFWLMLWHQIEMLYTFPKRYRFVAILYFVKTAHSSCCEYDEVSSWNKRFYCNLLINLNSHKLSVCSYIWKWVAVWTKIQTAFYIWIVMKNAHYLR